MSDENKADRDKWQMDSLEEEDEIIELTDEVEPPPAPKAPKQDQLDEIVIDLDDDAIPFVDEEVHELMEAAVEDVDFDELAPLAEADESVIEPGEDAVENIFALEDDSEPVMVDDASGFKGAEEDEVDIDALEDDLEETLLGLEDDAMKSPETEIQELMQAGMEEAGYEATGSMSDATEDLIDLDGDTLPVINEDDDVAEIGLEGLLSDDGGEEIGMSDIETEVDIDEVADLEPIIPETIPEMEPVIESDSDIALDEELTTEFVDPLPSPTDDIIEISEFDQQYFDEETSKGAVDGLPPLDETEEDDFLELIDVDEVEDDDTELDDEIIRFDQIEAEEDSLGLENFLSDPDPAESIPAPPDGLEINESPDLNSPFVSELTDQTATADLISGAGERIETDGVPSFFESSPAEQVMDAGEEEIGNQTDSDDELATIDDSDAGSAEIPAAISVAQIEAAVANIIERDYAGQIENMVASAIEKVVSLEIERIKTRLFEDDQD